MPDSGGEGQESKNDRQRLPAAVEETAAVSLDPAYLQERLRTLVELIDAGELTVALQILAENVFEFRVPIPDPTRRAVLEIAASLGLDQKYVDMIADPD